MIMYFRYLSLLCLLTIAVNAQQFTIERIEPPNWWAKMEHDTVQVLIYGKNIADVDIFPQHGPIDITNVHKAESPNYLFIDIYISKEISSDYNFEIGFSKGNQDTVIKYPILARENSNNKYHGFDQNDIMYLIMADRFCDGNPANNKVGDSLDQFTEKNLDGRKGGDIEGITSKLEYLKNLGITSIWITPMLENNMWMSYHGYAATDLYKIDPRLGSNELYKELVDEAHHIGLKIIMDHVSNHIGINHWWMKDLPSPDWIHQFDHFTRTNYRASAYMDPYAAKSDAELMEKGWFDTSMPDLNQANPLVETYLTQNSIWWIAYSGIDGIRMDTYPYPEKNMMSRWAKRVTDEFPGFFIVGEVWYQQEALTAYWALDKKNEDGYQSNLPSLTDFPLSLATHRAFSEPDSWTDGIARLYLILSQDFIYPHPFTNVIFLDNHDLTRLYTETGKNLDVYKMALSFILTTRGIPQFYYGTEIVMEGDKSKGDGYLRQDFPGGWQGDSKNVFTGTNLSDTEKEAYDFTVRLLNWRKNAEVIHSGKLKQYIPEDGIYVYFRYSDKGSVMVILNNNSTSRSIRKEKYLESMEGFTKGYEVITGKMIDDLNSFRVGPKTAMIIELK